jgi:hypothetical protein
MGERFDSDTTRESLGGSSKARFAQASLMSAMLSLLVLAVLCSGLFNVRDEKLFASPPWGGIVLFGHGVIAGKFIAAVGSALAAGAIACAALGAGHRLRRAAGIVIGLVGLFLWILVIGFAVSPLHLN